MRSMSYSGWFIDDGSIRAELLVTRGLGILLQAA